MMDTQQELREEFACAWVEYRKTYGINERDMQAAHKAFKQGWLVGKGLATKDNPLT